MTCFTSDDEFNSTLRAFGLKFYNSQLYYIKDKKSNGLYLVKDLNITFNLNIETNSLEITEKSVIIDYVLSIEEENAGDFRIEIYFN